jgi:hypothetical protein
MPRRRNALRYSARLQNPPSSPLPAVPTGDLTLLSAVTLSTEAAGAAGRCPPIDTSSSASSAGSAGNCLALRRHWHQHSAATRRRRHHATAPKAATRSRIDDITVPQLAKTRSHAPEHASAPASFVTDGSTEGFPRVSVEISCRDVGRMHCAPEDRSLRMREPRIRPRLKPTVDLQIRHEYQPRMFHLTSLPPCRPNTPANPLRTDE